MATIAVVHNTLDLRGGADAVCLHACEALGRDHDVRLLTLSHPPLAELDAVFDTDAARAVRVETPSWGGPVAKGFAAAAPHVGPQLPLRSVLLDRWLRRRRGEFDLVVSTANEFDVPGRSVQYVHYPQFRARRGDPGEEASGGGSEADTDRSIADRIAGGRELPNAVWSRAAGVGDGELPEGAHLLANSSYTARAVATRYGREPEVLHPPVDPITGGPDWDAREDGVVILGRLAPDKRALTALEIVAGVRERGHDLTAHVVGTAAPAYRTYADRVAAAAADREWAHLHRDCSRERLEELLTTTKYGLSAKPNEHFGMAVAEYVAAGMVAFAPDSGGQRDVLDGDPDRLYTSATDAVETVAAAVERGDRPTLPRDRFARERFHERLRDVVETQLPPHARR